MSTHGRVEVAETSAFQRWVRKQCVRAEVDGLIQRLKADPQHGVVIPGSGGLRKVRMAKPGRGKRGGYRIIYAVLIENRYLGLLAGYDKTKGADLTRDDLGALTVAAGVFEAQLRAALAAGDLPGGNS